MSENMVKEMPLSGQNASFSIRIYQRGEFDGIHFMFMEKPSVTKHTNIFSHVDFERKITLPNELCKLCFFLYFLDYHSGYNIILFIHFTATHLLNVFMCSNKM
jgi:hypothetical protein